MMDQDIKKLWVDALRSKEYEQGRGHLRDNNRFCCLGVLCDLHSKQTGTGEWLGQTYYTDSGTSTGLPQAEVWQWAGLESRNPSVSADRVWASDPKITKDDRELADLNDCGYTFSEIADLIEEQL